MDSRKTKNSEEISFIVSSVGPPQECYNTITPNDMQSDARCAVAGAVLFFGAWVVILSCEEPWSQALLLYTRNAVDFFFKKKRLF